MTHLSLFSGNRTPLSMSCPEDIPLCPCQKQRCVWWDEDSQDCAAVVLARAIKKRK